MEPLAATVLKSWSFADWQARYGHGSQLPYRMDYLEQDGITLTWSDALHQEDWRRSRTASLLDRAESALVPFAQTLILARSIARTPVTLAMFESEANFLAAFRSAMPGKRSSVLAVMTCWLTDILLRAGRRRLRGYRMAYRKVDRVYCLSVNQAPLLADLLDIPSERVMAIPFGVDTEEYVPPDQSQPDGGYVLVVGRDRGRDWPTTFQALTGLNMPVKLCARQSDLTHYQVPSDIEFLGYVERNRYRELVSGARVVAIASRPLVYPSGQSVLLESMSAGRCVVVTHTEAISQYVRDGVTCLTVPAGDPEALRARVLEAAADSPLRERTGAAARATVEKEFSAQLMWRRIARDLDALARNTVADSLSVTGKGAGRRKTRSATCS